MDLAKIRKKSLLTPGEPGAGSPATLAPAAEPVKNALESAPASSAPAEVDAFQGGSCFTQAASPVVTPPFAAIPQGRVVATCTPLEAILAGRSAAGCCDESILAEEGAGEMVVESCLEFLCFRVSDEIYGINIMDIKEIIKPREVTEVPRAPVFVSGVLSLRGTIIPVIDMRVRLGLAREEPTGKGRIIVIKSDNSFSGLLVDEVTQVVKVPPDEVEAAPSSLDGIDRDFISGLGRSGGRFIIILNLKNIADINLY